LQGFFQFDNFHFDYLFLGPAQVLLVQSLFLTHQAHLFTVVVTGVLFVLRHIQQVLQASGLT
jgi:hypothetical protein